MVFTVTDSDGKKQTFEGISTPFCNTMAFPFNLAIVTIGGSTEMWRLDRTNPKHALAELQRYYRTTEGAARDDDGVRIAVFTREGIYGVENETNIDDIVKCD